MFSIYEVVWCLYVLYCFHIVIFSLDFMSLSHRSCKSAECVSAEFTIFVFFSTINVCHVYFYLFLPIKNRRRRKNLENNFNYCASSGESRLFFCKKNLNLDLYF